MKIVSGMFKSAYMVLGRQQYIPTTKYVMIPYLSKLEVHEGMLLYNILTREIVLMLANEWGSGLADEFAEPDRKWMVEHWYLIPDGLDAKTLNYTFQRCHAARFKQGSGKLDLCTIFTTTECNARCPYCYERGCRKRSMTNEIALDVAKFIEAHCGAQIHLKWFGGEPLCNPDAIDIICGYLQEHGVKYDSSLISNGFLIKQHDPDKLKNLWRLNRVQITLDGTQETYNKTKNFVSGGNAFKNVIEGIKYLAQINVQVNIRLNLSKDNYADLIDLVNYLEFNLGAYPQTVSIYTHPLFEDDNFRLEKDERTSLYNQYIMLHNYISGTGLGMSGGIPKIRHDHCMADNGRSTVILPGGELSLCEHHCDDEIYGTIYSDEYDQDVIQDWAKSSEEMQECGNCFYYPACYRLEKCPAKPTCDSGYRKFIQYKTHRVMLDAYKRRLGK